MSKSFFDVTSTARKPDLGLLVIRLALGVIFVAHGWQKFGDMEGTIAFFSSIGFAPFFAYLVSAVEFLGGLAMVLGVWTHLAGLLLAIVMLVAILLLKGKSGLLGGYEFDLMLLASALGISMLGPGKHVMKAKTHDK